MSRSRDTVRRARPQIAKCIGCGCDDDHACELGCYWLRVDYDAGKGVCSECPAFAEQWDRGDRTDHSGEPGFDPAEEEIVPTEAERARKRFPDGRCDHFWPRLSPHDSDACCRCGMSFTRYIFTECP